MWHACLCVSVFASVRLVCGVCVVGCVNPLCPRGSLGSLKSLIVPGIKRTDSDGNCRAGLELKPSAHTCAHTGQLCRGGKGHFNSLAPTCHIFHPEQKGYLGTQGLVSRVPCVRSKPAPLTVPRSLQEDLGLCSGMEPHSLSLPGEDSGAFLGRQSPSA